MNEATFKGGNIKLFSERTNFSQLQVMSEDSSNPNYSTVVSSGGVKIRRYNTDMLEIFNGITSNETYINLTMRSQNGNLRLDMTGEEEGGALYLYNPDGTSIYLEGQNGHIRCTSLTQTSLSTQKKNFEKMKDSALQTIKNIDIYKYNLKNEKDTDKKHIGFVIGDKYNYSKEVTSLDNTGVDNYSFTSLCCKAIQELSQKVEELENKIKEMEEK